MPKEKQRDCLEKIKESEAGKEEVETAGKEESKSKEKMLGGDEDGEERKCEVEQKEENDCLGSRNESEEENSGSRIGDFEKKSLDPSEIKKFNEEAKDFDGEEGRNNLTSENPLKSENADSNSSHDSLKNKINEVDITNHSDTKNEPRNESLSPLEDDSISKLEEKSEDDQINKESKALKGKETEIYLDFIKSSQAEDNKELEDINSDKQGQNEDTLEDNKTSKLQKEETKTEEEINDCQTNKSISISKRDGTAQTETKKVHESSKNDVDTSGPDMSSNLPLQSQNINLHDPVPLNPESENKPI